VVRPEIPHMGGDESPQNAFDYSTFTPDSPQIISCLGRISFVTIFAGLLVATDLVQHLS
jgi:hypothetical protein